jgi:FADH2 O2-dependent halogenase
MAAYLAKAGAKVVLFEREIMPRPHVGESLVPSSTRVFKELGFLPTMESAGFVRKYGAVWTSANAKGVEGHDFRGLDDELHPERQAEIKFAERDQPGVEQPYTWHVDRGRFDLLLLQHANKLGVHVYEGVRVDGVEFNQDEAAITYHIGRKAMSTSCRIVVDASGRHTLLGNQLGLKVRDPVYDQYAIHTWFDNYDRTFAAGSEAYHDHIFVHFLPVANSWIWQIPVTETLTSIGVVTQKKNFAKSKAEREQFFWDTAASRPDLYEALKAAKRVRPFKDEGDYSYAMKQICGDRFVLIGDAARFVDPIFSTGVSIALSCARFASRDVLEALQTGDYSRNAFSTYETTLRRGTQNWYDFISVYYRLNILFTYFVKNPRYRLDVVKLLQGDVYDEEAPAVLGLMRQAVRDVEQNPEHYWHRQLNELTHDAFAPTF